MNPNSPIAEANKIKDNSEFKQAITKILAEITEIDKEDKTNIVDEILLLRVFDMIHTSDQNGLLEITEQAKTDIAGALAKARAISTDSTCLEKRDGALTRVAIEQANQDLGGAFTTISEIKQSNYRQTSSSQIITNIFDDTSPLALKTLIDASSISIRPYLLAALAAEQSKVDVDLSYRSFLEALAVARRIRDSEAYNETVAKIFSVYAQVDPGMAIAKVNQFKELHLRALVLLEIATNLKVGFDD